MASASNYFCRKNRPFIITLAVLILYMIVTCLYFAEDTSLASLKLKKWNSNWSSEIFTHLANTGSKLVSSVHFTLLGAESNAGQGVACYIPKLDPFHKSIKHLIGSPENVDCLQNYIMLFNSTFSQTLVPSKTVEEMVALGVKSCCYKTIHRPKPPASDNEVWLSVKCFPVTLNDSTLVPLEHELLATYCEYDRRSFLTKLLNFFRIKPSKVIRELVDVHAFVPLKPTVEQRLSDIQKNRPSSSHLTLNVLILGMDSLSHMNFLRSMPKSYSFLTNELGATGLNGYNAIASTSFRNMAAALTSLSEKEINLSCLVHGLLDNCTFIWKNFSEHGFRTAFGEDWFSGGQFNFLEKRGFQNPPTDYYLRPLIKKAEEVGKALKRKDRGLCWGPRSSWQVLLDYTQKFATTMGKDKRYFQLAWSTALAHEGLNDGRMGDEPLLKTLKWFHEEGYLNQTILIVMSDHGFKTGRILDFPQGSLELRMPFVYFVMPPWFKKKYARAYQNLRVNQDRLSTPFDFHETLVDLITLEHITAEAIQAREQDLAMSTSLPRGISQFLPIPLSRTCEMAGVEDHWCSCRELQEISTTDPAVMEVTTFALDFINSILAKFPECTVLSLARVKSARVVASIKKDDKRYQVMFETTPSNASFDATVMRKKDGSWDVSGTIDRTNLYGNQSHCIEDKDTRAFCYCKDLIS